MGKKDSFPGIKVLGNKVEIQSFGQYQISYLHEHAVINNMQGDDKLQVRDQQQNLHHLTLDELQNYVSAGKFKHTDELSLDDGERWMKIYEHPHFDRRKGNVLRELPSQSLELNENEVIRLHHKTVQILVRIIETPPKLKISTIFYA